MIIAFCGYAGAGKSTAAEYTAKEYGFKRHNFKDGLVAEMKEKFPDVLRELSQAYHMDIDKLFQNKPATMRALMRNYGTEVRRGDDPFYWTKKWKNTLPEGNIVVDDVRFFNELSEITEADGVLIRIKRTDITSGGDHQSELEQTKFIEDFTITAEPGSHDSLYRQLDAIISELKYNVD